MKINSFFYTLQQGFKNIFRNKLFTLASLATIGACLFLFGIMYSVLANFENIIKNAENGVSVTVFFDEGLDDASIQSIGDLINNQTEIVDHVEFISAEEAWDSFKEEYLGEYADGFTENPLADSAHYEIYLKDVSRQQELVDMLNSLNGIRRVNQSEMTATTLTGINKLVAYISVGIIVILLAVSIFLISNTITIGISVRKEEIEIMKYIGATDFFVRSPFVVEGMLIGVIGTIVPLALIYFLYDVVIGFIKERFSVLSQLLTFLTIQEIFHVLVPISLAIGLGIGFLGSIITVRKHLRV
ncbi:MAG: permease-like cell division protein FtsX [Lachnospiraceae bacterium]|jgi:cell division transport system permease protein|nr:permease-like cell division protein FtsX [Lachnospiraceae bacterium]MCR4596505.1 permease-like cell division protein FtsX [Lachnospiraceae bacterium]